MNSSRRCLATDVVDKSSTALQDDIEIFRFGLLSSEIKALAVSSSEAIISFISNDAKDAAPIISALLQAISAQLMQQTKELLQ